MRIIDFKKFEKNTLRGFFTLEVSGMHIKDCTAHTQNDKTWFGFPGAAQLDKDGQPIRKEGKVQYKNIISVPDRDAADRLQAKVAEMLKEHLR